MKMLGTVVWPVNSPSVDWMAEPSSKVGVSSHSRHGTCGTQGQDSVYVRTNLVQLNRVELGARFGQQLLGRLAVGAVGFGEDGDGVLVDDGLDLCLCGGHGCGAVGAAEEAREEGYGCGCEGRGLCKFLVW